ncbi:hypothetical protein ANN_17764 [Periplaneta americana]|uniref:DUF4371 domain-containing protein n=1 Tax=Periplaneta americana TaxID=6978 RepID=A0ABQ8STW2_PERAM|nr:hypothetical protein ANN_17764 [Periplaneta americana]
MWNFAQTDDKLDHHLQTVTVFSGKSNDIQNDLIGCVFWVLINEIKKEISETSFIAVIMDESTYVSNKSQLSTIFRYVTCDGNVEERFIGFCDVSNDLRAVSLSEILIEYMDELKCGDKPVAQTYDGNAIKTVLSNEQPSKPLHVAQSDTSESVIRATFAISEIIAKKSKPFSDGEFVKECLQSVDIICPYKKTEFAKLNLWRQTVAHRIDELATTIEGTLKSQATNFEFYSLALESCDDSDTAQLGG